MVQESNIPALPANAGEPMDTIGEAPGTPIEEPAAPVAAEAPVAEPPPTVPPTAEAPPEPAPTELPLPVEIPAAPSEAEAQRIRQLEKQVADFAEAHAQQYLADEARQHQQELLQQGYDETQAAQVANQSYTFKMQAWNAYKANHTLQQTYDTRLNDTLEVASKYKVDPKDLGKYNTRAEMEAAAQTQGRMAAMEREISQLKQAKVPPQEFPTGTGEAPPATGVTALLDRMNDQGWDALSRQQREQVTAYLNGSQ